MKSDYSGGLTPTTTSETQARKVKKGEFLGLGAAIQAIGLACIFSIHPYGWIPGIVLLIVGGRMSIKTICSLCGNTTTKEAKP